MKTSFKFLLMAASMGAMTAHAGDDMAPRTQDCVRAAENVRVQVARDRSEVLNAVSSAVERDPGCACEITKVAIVSSRADKQTVAAIVSAAGNAAPDKLELIVQCATAAAPDASSNIQAAAAGIQASNGLAGGAGQGGLGGGMNPLDFPGDAPGVAVQGAAGTGAAPGGAADAGSVGSPGGALAGVAGTPPPFNDPNGVPFSPPGRPFTGFVPPGLVTNPSPEGTPPNP